MCFKKSFYIIFFKCILLIFMALLILLSQWPNGMFSRYIENILIKDCDRGLIDICYTNINCGMVIDDVFQIYRQYECKRLNIVPTYYGIDIFERPTLFYTQWRLCIYVNADSMIYAIRIRYAEGNYHPDNAPIDKVCNDRKMGKMRTVTYNIDMALEHFGQRSVSD